METPPRPVNGPQTPTERIPRISPEPVIPTPTEPIARVQVGESDTTVDNFPTPPPDGGDGRPPNMPWYILAVMAAVITLAIFWWYTQAQQEAQIQISATVTAATGATATADAEATAASIAQATATASQALAQATAIAQATAAAQGAAAVNATVGAQAVAAEQARATAEAIAAQANAAAEATRTAPTATAAATPTPVVVVVTATPPPAKPTAAAPPAVVPVAPPLPPPAPASSPAVSVPGSAPASPVAAPAGPASAPGPAASPAASTVNPVSVTAAAGQPTVLECLDDRVRISADPGALPAGAILTCRPVDQRTVPAPPGSVVGGTIFRLDASPSEGGKLPGPVTMVVTYPPDAAPLPERDRLVLGYLDGTAWKPVPDQDAAPAEMRISDTVDRSGVYALYLRP